MATQQGRTMPKGSKKKRSKFGFRAAKAKKQNVLKNRRRKGRADLTVSKKLSRRR